MNTWKRQICFTHRNEKNNWIELFDAYSLNSFIFLHEAVLWCWHGGSLISLNSFDIIYMALKCPDMLGSKKWSHCSIFSFSPGSKKQSRQKDNITHLCNCLNEKSERERERTDGESERRGRLKSPFDAFFLHAHHSPPPPPPPPHCPSPSPPCAMHLEALLSSLHTVPCCEGQRWKEAVAKGRKWSGWGGGDKEVRHKRRNKKRNGCSFKSINYNRTRHIKICKYLL